MKLLRGVFLLVLVLGAGHVFAQETPDLVFDEPIPLFFELTEVAVPEGWDYFYDEDTSSLMMLGEDLALAVQIFDSLDQNPALEIDLTVPLDEALVDIYSALYDLDVDLADVTLLEVDDAVTLALIEYSPENFTFLVQNTEHEMLFLVEAYNTDAEAITDEQFAVIGMIIATVRPIEDASGASVEVPAECLLTVSEPDAVQLRVGPGTNRTVVAFLDVGDYTPLGQTTADDDSLWFKLDKEIAAPGSSANEIWVAGDEVTTAGDCAAVPDAAAPPVIPGVVAPPADASGAGTAEVITIEPGTYTMSFGTSNASCAGTPNVTLTPSQLGLEPFTATVRQSGNTLIVGNNVHTLQENGQYFGSSTLDANTNGQFYLWPTSATSIQGNLITNMVLDNQNCSVTTPLFLTR